MTRPSGIPTLQTPIQLEKVVGDFERKLIVQALDKCNGVQTRAAALLGITRRILRYRMDKLDIPTQRNPRTCSSCHSEKTQ